jgi:ribonuclease D
MRPLVKVAPVFMNDTSSRFPTGATDVQNASAAAAAAAALENNRELAVDVEADSMHAFRARLCFVQLGTDHDIFLFDTLEPGVDVSVLKNHLSDPQRTKYFHAAGGDLQFLAEAGVRVKGLFDTHRAATLLGWPKVGLADLARERLGVELKKEHQQSDFSIRPLPLEMRAYIADDVRYLCEIGRQVRAECLKADILEEVELDCQRLADEAVNRPDVGADFRPKIPRQGLSKVQLALAEALIPVLHAQRLRWAEAANIPMGRMLANAALVEIATRPPSTPRDLARLKGVRGGFVREHGDEVLATIASLRQKAESGELVPAETRAPPDPARRKREEKLKIFRGAEAVARKVTPSVVLGNPLVDELARSGPTSLEELAKVPYMGEKRIRLYGEKLLALLKS